MKLYPWLLYTETCIERVGQSVGHRFVCSFVGSSAGSSMCSAFKHRHAITFLYPGPDE
jgi:hypothetical protein